jgi:hypothetical protein
MFYPFLYAHVIKLFWPPPLVLFTYDKHTHETVFKIYFIILRVSAETV